MRAKENLAKELVCWITEALGASCASCIGQETPDEKSRTHESPIDPDVFACCC